MTRRAFIRSAACALVATGALAKEPVLARYVSNENADVFVALYAGQAVELAGCEDETAARNVLALPATTPVVERDFVDLSDAAGLGDHPEIPCSSSSPLAQAVWPAPAQLWADLADNARYLLAAPEGADSYYAIDAGCDGIKDALQIRERAQTVDAFQGFGAPAMFDLRLTYSCGPGASPVVPQQPGTNGGSDQSWLLHKVELFLTEEGLPDTLFVASGPTEKGRGYLPVLRLDGRDVAPQFLGDPAILAQTEATLRTLFNVPAEALVTPLSFEAQEAVQSALFADLCTLDCAGYPFNHGHFVVPGIDFLLSFEAQADSPPAIDTLGGRLSEISYGAARVLRLSGCDALAGALGLNIEGGNDWPAMVAAAQARTGTDTILQCDAPAAQTCTRLLDAETPLLPAFFRPVAECAGKTRLRLLLPEFAQASEPIFIAQTSGFKTIEIAPAPGVERAVLTVPAGRSGENSACLPSAPRTMIHAVGDVHLTLRNLSLRRRTADLPQQGIGIQIDGGTLVTDGVTMIADGGDDVPPERGISLCTGAYYARATRVHASELALQGSAGRIAMTGSDAAPTTFSSNRFAASASAGTVMQLQGVSLAARIGLSLFNATLQGSRITFASTQPQGLTNTALQMRGRSDARIFQSTAQGFACVGTFWSSESTATFTLPGNDLAADNTRVSCALGTVSVLE